MAAVISDRARARVRQIVGDCARNFTSVRLGALESKHGIPEKLLVEECGALGLVVRRRAGSLWAEGALPRRHRSRDEDGA